EYNNIEVYISFLRKKLKVIGSNVTIKTARGIGYCLENGE
ncbi:MAG: helix-turn-helix domain-containing protein, partial [Oscillospiraceae bacterium]|nr:helix-turn-helix domain-containing protein [Oscillospiraceae bacterium]